MADTTPVDDGVFYPSITISRMTGSRAVSIARMLADYLDLHDSTAASHGWTLYDKDLVKAIIKDNKLPIEIQSHMPEDKVGLIHNYIEKMTVGTTDDQLFKATVETIHRLGHLGHTIIVGRGANLINRDLPNCFHIRLFGSEDRRLGHTRAFYDLSDAEAKAKMASQDGGRHRYVESHFGENIENPMLYHLVMNTDHHPDVNIVKAIGDQVLAWADHQRRAKQG